MKKYRYISLLAMAIFFATGLRAQEHPTVDLGLPSGTLWSTCDLGSDTPSRPGSPFAWGETESKHEAYVFATYKWGHSSKEIQKYNTQEKNGRVDRLTELEPCDDAATALWGEGWRIPTEEQVRELVAGCTWSWVVDEESGISDCRFVSKTNGNTLSFIIDGFFRGYWTSTLREDSPRYARTLYMEKTRTGKTPGFVGFPFASRFTAHCIRPVYLKK